MNKLKKIIVKKIFTFIITIFSGSILLSGNAKCQVKQQQYNVLFIVVDDLRPELGSFGVNSVISPNIDKLAKTGFVFTNAYCQVPVCGASRASLFTGLRPNREKFLEAETKIDNDAPGIATLPKHLKENGYITISNGKVIHHQKDAANSWSEPAWSPEGHWRDYQTKENIALGSDDKKKFIGNSYENADVDDYTYIDGKVVKKSISDMQKLKSSGQPFFLAVGLRKPHLPFNAPKKYWDMYDSSKIELAKNPFVPKNAPLESIHNSFELRAYKDIPDTGKISDSKSRILKHGYYACISYIDALIGKLLSELKTLDLEKNTIVVLLGDNGYQLGEHSMWIKHCNYETSLNVPLILKVPGTNSGKEVNSLVEFIDVYPTLCELNNISLPSHLHGTSLKPLINGSKSKIKDVVFSRYQSGESIRTEKHLYTEYFDKDGKFVSKMLYDHQKDPAENINIVNTKRGEKLSVKYSKMLKEHREKYYSVN